MSIKNKSTSQSRIGLGQSHLSDAFQAGREAAQLARSQISIDYHYLALVFSPDSHQFQDAIEGAQLITGDKNFLGLPIRSSWPSSSGPSTTTVILIQTEENWFSLASSQTDPPDVYKNTTQILTQLRNARGNKHHDFNHHGVLLMSNLPAENNQYAIDISVSDFPLDRWVIGITPTDSQNSSLICGDKKIKNGFVALECLSLYNWGIGTVNLSAFHSDSTLIQEGIKSALRDALSQIKNNKPLLGLVFYDVNVPDPSSEKPLEPFSFSPDKFPICTFGIKRQLIRPLDRTWQILNNSIMALILTSKSDKESPSKNGPDQNGNTTKA